MIPDLTEWHRHLVNVTGVIVRGEQRVTTRELLTEHLGVSVTIKLVGACAGSCVILDGKGRGGCDGVTAL